MTRTGGFRPGLTTKSQGVTAESSFLASEHYMVKRGGITVDASTVGANANGDKILKRGTAMGKITSSGKFRAYVNSNNDGSETAVGLLMETINLRDGDVVCGLMIHGSAILSRTSGLDASGKADLTGIVLQ